MSHPFAPGALIIVYLQNPREKIWGVLLGLDAAGVAVRGLDLRSFDDWLRGLNDPEEQGIRPSVSFYPMSRVEKIVVDEPAEGAPSLDAQCAARSGFGLKAHLGRLDAPAKGLAAGAAE